MNAAKPTTIDEYIRGFPPGVRRLLQRMRRTIKKAAPNATQTISYGMPAFRDKTILVWFGAHTSHIGLYPGASGIAAFKKQLSGYKIAKGSVQFPFGEPLPLALVTRIVKFRAKFQRR
jgi:uncharacterized protein YdhG (YjbR/CyaY superfamily)